MNSKKLLLIGSLVAIGSIANVQCGQKDKIKDVYRKANRELKKNPDKYNFHITETELKLERKGLLTPEAQAKAATQKVELKMLACMNGSSRACEEGVKKATENFVLRNKKTFIDPEKENIDFIYLTNIVLNKPPKLRPQGNFTER